MYVENFPTKIPRWIPGTVVKVTGPLSYVIKLQNGKTVRRHVDSMRERENSTTEQNSDTMMFGPELGTVVEEVPDTQPDQTSQEVSTVPPKECFESNTADSGQTQETDSGLTLRRSTRSHNPPDRFGT